MTIRAIYLLECDGDCGDSYPAPVEVIEDRQALLKAAEVDGWRILTHPPRHRCPRCLAHATTPSSPDTPTNGDQL